MLSTASTAFMVEKTGACVQLRVRSRTIVSSIEVALSASSLPVAAGVGEEGRRASPSCVIWALVKPQRERQFADGLYSVTLPVALGCVTPSPSPSASPSTCRAVLALGRWELVAGASVALTLAPAELSAEDVRATLMPETQPSSPSTAVVAQAAESASRALAPLQSVVWRLSGSQVESAADDGGELEWQPLLHRRWYELKSYVREGTVVPYYSSAANHRSDRGTAASDSDASVEGSRSAPPQPLYAGDVKEAEAISINRQCVLWTDGSVGLYDEVKPFHRIYQPARAEKTVRVRRFPHRYADVIGEVPFQQCVEACGRATDPYTQEQYVLLYLPEGAAFADHVATYDLAFVSDGRYVWGWSKVAGSSGLPLLMEQQTDGPAGGALGAAAARSASPATSPAPVTDGGRSAPAADGSGETAVMPLPEITFYTPVREGRPVRIRKRPTLTATTIREMEANEVRAAEALLTVPQRVPGDASGTLVPHVFVQWQQGGYSLLRNAVECFLTPVVLSRVPRRFPIRTRSSSSGGGGAAVGTEGEAEVIDLTRRRPAKRPRQTSGGPAGDSDDTEAELRAMMGGRKATRADDSLLSPHALPVSLQEQLRSGVVRVDDLPPLQQPSEESDRNSGSD